MGRHRRRVDAVEAQPAQQGEGQQRQDDAQAEDQCRLAEQRQAGLFGQLHATVQADGQQQHDGQGVIQRRWQFQLAFQQPGRQAEDKEQYDGIKTHDALRR